MGVTTVGVKAKWKHYANDSGCSLSQKTLRIFTGSIARSASLPVFNLLRGRFWGFSPRRGDMLHRWGEIWLGGEVPSSMPNFTPIGATMTSLVLCMDFSLGHDALLGCNWYRNLPILPIPILLACSDTDARSYLMTTMVDGWYRHLCRQVCCDSCACVCFGSCTCIRGLTHRCQWAATKSIE